LFFILIVSFIGSFWMQEKQLKRKSQNHKYSKKSNMMA